MNTANQYINGTTRSGQCMVPQTNDRLCEMYEQCEPLTTEFMAFVLLVTNVTLKVTGSPFEDCSSDISPTNMFQGFVFNWLLVHFFHKGHARHYFDLPTYSHDDGEIIFELKRKAAIGQLAVVTSAYEKAGVSLPDLKSYFLQTRLEEMVEQDGEADYADDGFQDPDGPEPDEEYGDDDE